MGLDNKLMEMEVGLTGTVNSYSFVEEFKFLSLNGVAFTVELWTLWNIYLEG